MDFDQQLDYSKIPTDQLIELEKAYAAETNYEFYLKAKDNPELLKPKPEIFVPEKKIVIAS